MLTVIERTRLLIPPKIDRRFLHAGATVLFVSRSNMLLFVAANRSIGGNIPDPTSLFPALTPVEKFENEGGGSFERNVSSSGRNKGAASRAKTIVAGTGA